MAKALERRQLERGIDRSRRLHEFVRPGRFERALETFTLISERAVPAARHQPDVVTGGAFEHRRGNTQWIGLCVAIPIVAPVDETRIAERGVRESDDIGAQSPTTGRSELVRAVDDDITGR